MRIKNSTCQFPRHSRFRLIATVTALATSLLLVSCAENTVESTGPEVEQAVGLAVDAPRITVVSSGDGDKTLISYVDVATEEDQRLTLSVSDGFAQTISPADQVDPIAPTGGEVSTMRFPMTANTIVAEESAEETLSASRDITIKVEQPAYTDLDLTEDIRSGEGFTLGIRALDNGQQSTISFAAPTEATDTGRVIIEQYLLKFTSLPVLFPDEEIGVGAQWSVDSRVSGESTLLQTVTYTINAIRGDLIDLDVSVSQRPSLGAIDIDESTEGITGETPKQLTVLNSNTSSNGSLTVDLTKPLPTSGSVSWTTRVIYGGAVDDNRVVQDATSEVSFESRN